MIIVLVTQGKGNDRPYNFAVRLFEDATKALQYIAKVSKPDEKYWTVSGIVEDGEVVEPMREGFAASFSTDWIKC